MANVFKSKNSTGIGTSYVNVYEASDPLTSAIIFSFSLTNNLNDIVTASVRIVDSTNITSAYIINESQIVPHSTLVLAGDEQKIILKQGDKVEVRCSDSGGLDVFISSIDADPSVAYGTGGGGGWYGDLGFLTGGQSYNSYVDKFSFSSQSASHLTILNPFYYNYPSGVSNGVIGLLLTYASNNSSYTTSLTYADDNIQYNYSNIYYHVHYAGSATNGSLYVMAGGYYSGYKNYLQSGDYESGTIAILFGYLDRTNRYLSSGVNNSIYGLFCGGNYNNNYIRYIEFATMSNSNLWGYLAYSCNNIAGASNNDMSIINTGGSNTYNLYYIDFASQANSQSFGSRITYDYTDGACSDGTTALFVQGEFQNSCKIDFANLGGTVEWANTWGWRGFDGGRPTAMTGGN
ncbi:MAG: hypothetical protein DRQ78_09640 [Epsilonproteobacteria bacterium]|nr:MAG: hypothetical protein DRQ78_09640 [Campylobacterota bacterium]